MKREKTDRRIAYSTGNDDTLDEAEMTSGGHTAEPSPQADEEQGPHDGWAEPHERCPKGGWAEPG